MAVTFVAVERFPVQPREETSSRPWSSPAAPDGGPLTAADREAAAARTGDLSRFAVGGQVAPPQFSPDGTVALVAVPLSTAGGQEQVADTVDRLLLRGLLAPALLVLTVIASFFASLGAAWLLFDHVLLVRTVLVPALAFVLGDRFWWPGRVRREAGAQAPAPREPVTAHD
uniref:hypothetical protein n=1 Tax=Micromonospora thermarum TaxID=2720024 RepID=UPI0035A0A7C6